MDPDLPFDDETVVHNDDINAHIRGFHVLYSQFSDHKASKTVNRIYESHQYSKSFTPLYITYIGAINILGIQTNRWIVS